MQGNVHKKKTDVDLWEIVTPEKKKIPRNGTNPKNGTRQQGSAKRASSRPVKSLQIIGQDEEIRPTRQSRPAQSDKQSRSVQPIGQNRTSRSVRQSKPVQPIGQGRMSQPVRQSRIAQPYQRPAQTFRPERSPQAIKRKKARKRRAYLYRSMAFIMAAFCTVCVFMLVGLAYNSVQEWRKRDIVPVTKTPIVEDTTVVPEITAPEITTSYLDINEYSRPGTKLDKINSIFVHYTANPGTSAAQNRSYFSNLSETKERSASAHFIIGYEGEIIQCIPLDEQAYAVVSRNEDSISIECCYLEEDGEFTQATYDSLVHLLAWLRQEYDLEIGDILRHYDCGGKLCPLYYVENESAWVKLLMDVGVYQDEQEEK